MKKILFIGLLFLLASCFNRVDNTNETELLKRRINSLEQRLDSLLYGVNINLAESNFSSSNQTVNKPIRYSTRCQALTKKGTQCKRNANKGGYCWQHGGR